MKEFKVKDIDIATGGTLVCVLNAKDAVELDVHPGDRLKLQKGRKITTAVVDISETSQVVTVGKIGMMEELLKKLKVKQGDKVIVSFAEKPHSVSLIKRKLKGEKLSTLEISEIIQDIVKNRLTEVEITYFVAGSFVHGMDLDEIVAMTRTMINTGDVLKIDCSPIVDKHCIGGVPGNRTTNIVVPILVAAGYCMPKTSSRSITSPAGTADTMEVLANVDLDIKKIKKVVNKVGGCMTWGGAVNLAPADDKIITVERPLSIDAEAQLLASILAKKGSVSATHVLIDIPVGRGAKIKNMRKAARLEKMFKLVGKKLGMKIKVVVTDGSQPIGNGIGPALEAIDVLKVLRNDEDAPQDLRDKSLRMASEMMKSWPINKEMKGKGFYYAKKMLESGAAHAAMIAMIEAQGKKITDPAKIKVGKSKFVVKARAKGKVRYMDNMIISRIARGAGAPHDKGAGLLLKKHVGDKVVKGETIMEIYAENKHKLEYAVRLLGIDDGFVVS